ncbi:MAG: IS200/IS605 family transposase [Verrucomicrobiota bacterium]
MPQSLTQMYVHLVFSTRDREPWLTSAVRPKVHAYLATILRNMGSPYVVAGGVADHVHLLFELPKEKAPTEVVAVVKRESSKFMKTLGPAFAKFCWQRGYGMFSVSPTRREKVEEYVRNQEEHHRTRTFQEEFRKFLDQYGIEYDERYVWD